MEKKREEILQVEHSRQLAIQVDRAKLRDVVEGLRGDALRKAENGDWCVACGAGAASAKLDFPQDLVREAGAQFLDAKALRDLATSLRDQLGEQAWCVACGAGAKAGPEARINPAPDLSDAMIDEIARQLLGAVRVE